MCFTKHSFFLMLTVHPLLIVWMKCYLVINICNSYISWWLTAYFIWRVSQNIGILFTEVVWTLGGSKEAQKKLLYRFQLFFYIGTLYPVRSSVWSSSKEQKMFSDFEISLEWVSDFAGQMNCCYFCDSARGISSTQAIQQQLLFASSNKSLKSISLSLLSSWFFTFH